MSDDKFSSRKEPSSIQTALRGVLGGVMRQIRKYSALSVCLDILPPELIGQVAPFDVRLAAPLDAGANAERTPDTGGAPQLDEVTTMYLYVLSATVQLALEQNKRRYIDAINAQLPYPLVEELRFEQANAAKIARQLNILGTTPD
jgi:hypothetical protein